jgi:hypothetical protein
MILGLKTLGLIALEEYRLTVSSRSGAYTFSSSPPFFGWAARAPGRAPGTFFKEGTSNFGFKCAGNLCKCRNQLLEYEV